MIALAEQWGPFTEVLIIGLEPRPLPNMANNVHTEKRKEPKQFLGDTVSLSEEL